jgi:hypothetical protein
MPSTSPSGSSSPYGKIDHHHRTSSLDLESAKDVEENYEEKDEKESSEYTTIGCKQPFEV